MSGKENPVIRKAKPEDARIFGELVLYASPEYSNLFDEDAEPLMEYLFRRRSNLFSHEHAMIAEVEGDAVGMILSYGYADKMMQTLYTALLICGRVPLSVINNFSLMIGNMDNVGNVFAGEKYISHLMVYPDKRGGGVGAALVEAFEAAAWREGFKKSVLETNEANVKAVAFYNRLGYKEVNKLSMKLWGKKKVYCRMEKKL